ncbi:copper resistance protein CopC [Streptomyces sp. NPDC026672]|uniref:copper resistance CopC/CopD family protein n=1 Tax=unclassified Streptomyces TaxID=2593676 RepID=UPI003405B62F
MLLGTLLALLVLGPAVPASAHAALRDTDPADGSVVKAAPAYLTLTFTESVGLLDDSFRVYDPGNHRVTTGAAEHAPGRSDTARVSLPPELGTGTFTVAWRVVSADSHPVAGAFTFSVGKPSATTANMTAAPVEDPVTGRLYDIARYLAYLSVALLIGATAFLTLCAPAGPGPLHRPLRTGWWVLLASTAALFVLRAPYEAGAGPASALDPAGLARTAGGRTGQLLLARLALLLVAAVLLPRLRRGSRTALAAGATTAVALALTWAAAEHSSAGIQVPVAITASVLHLLAMAVWLGGLAALLVLLHRAPAALPPAAITRFSRLAFGAVTVLVATGAYLSWRGLGSWAALTDTSYGRVLLLKLAAVLLLLATAAQSRRWTARLAGAEAAVVPERVPELVGGAAGAAGTAAAEERAGERRGVTAPVADGSSADVPRSSDVRQGSGVSPGSDVPRGSGVSPGTGALPGSDVLPGSGTPSGSDVSPRPDVLPGSGAPSAVGGSDAVGAAPEDGGGSVPLSPHQRALRRSVLAEVAVGAVVLVVTTVLTSTLPGRAVAESTAAGAAAGIPAASVTDVPFSVGKSSGKVQVTLDPGRVGRNSVEAVVFGADGGLALVPELRISFTLPAQKLGPLDAKVTDQGGYWGTEDLDLPIPGTWTMKVTVRVSDIDQVTVARPVTLVR